MRNLLRRIDHDGERWLLLWLYGYIVMVIFVEVIRRFVLSYSSVWGEETARYAFVYLVWIGAAAAVRERAHIRIDVITHLVGQRGTAILYIAADVLTGILALFALYWSMDPVLTSLKFHSVTDGLRVLRVWFLFAVPFGFSIMLLRVFQSLVRDVGNFRAGRPTFTGARLFE
ncbi:MAG: TRAP transporter small permease [Rhodospirillales bacterium]|nr:TRAP transporter small permease [Rhodospirillales bacterium]